MPNWFNTNITEGLRDLDERVSGLGSLKKSIKTFQNVDNVSILDVGCAEGLIGDWLTEANGIITGIDADQDKIDAAKKLFPKQTFIQGNADSIAELIPEDAKYDVVLLLAILQKLNDPMPTLLEALKRSRKFVAIRVPDYWYKQYWTPEFYGSIRNEWYISHYAPAAEPDEKFLGHLIILNRNGVAKDLDTIRKSLRISAREKSVRDAQYTIVSFPKSGRTWLRYYLGTWLNLEYNAGVDLEFMPQPYWTAERHAVDFPHIHFTHDYFDLHQDDDDTNPTILYKQYYDKKPTILLVRNPFDTIVSYYYHKAKRESITNMSLSEFVLSSRYGVGRYCDWMVQMLDYAKTNPNMMILSYEEMRKGMTKQMRKVFQFMHIDDPHDHLPMATKLSSFKAMQDAEVSANNSAEGIGRLGMPNWDGDMQKLKVRKGEVGTWRDEIDEVALATLLHDPRVKVYLARLAAICPASSPLL